jgi:hypothetical protein
LNLTSPRAKRFYKDVKEKYNLRIDEEVLLEEACAEIDTLDALRTRAGTGTAQLKHRAVLMRLLRQLKLADVPPGKNAVGPVGSDTTSKARRAAMVKWGRQG